VFLIKDTGFIANEQLFSKDFDYKVEIIKIGNWATLRVGTE
jgi:hypothetical protein